METVNVLVATPIDEELLKRIATVSPRVKLQNVWDLSRADFRGDSSAKDELDIALADAEIVYGIRLPRDLLAGHRN